MKNYELIVDNGNDIFRVDVIAETKAKAKAKIEKTNGVFAGRVVEVRESDLQNIDCQFLERTLRDNGYGQQERNLIYNALRELGFER